MCRAFLAFWLLLATLQFFPPSPLAAQKPDTAQFKFNEKVALDQCLGVLDAHPELYAYVTVDANKKRVLRFSQKRLRRANGRHPEDPPPLPDMALDLFGLALSKKALNFLEDRVSEHNEQIKEGPEKNNAAPNEPNPVNNRPGARNPAPANDPQAVRERMAEAKRKLAEYRQNAAVEKQPPVRQPSGTRREYRDVAQVLSYDYRLSGREVTPELTPKSLEAVKKTISPQIEKASSLMLLGIREEQKLRGSGQRAADNAAKRAEEVRNAAARGEYTRTEIYYDSDGAPHEYQVDESQMPVIMSSLAAGFASEVAHEVELIHRRLMLDGAKIRAWDELLPEMAQQHAGPVSNRALVQIDYLDDGPGGRPLPQAWKPQLPFAPTSADTFQGRYVAKNLAQRDLHNVTLAVDMYHYSTLPAVALRHVYFIPEWKQGDSVELSRSFLLDFDRGGKLYNVVAMEKQGAGAPEANPQLVGLAGMVQMRTTVWADEARQDPLVQKLPERAKAVSKVLIKYADQTVTSRYATDDEVGKLKTQMLLERHLDPVLAIMPADSPEVEHARRLLSDSTAARKEVQQAMDDALLAACAEGKKHVGTWKGPAIGATDIGVLFVSRDPQGQRIRAEIFNPRKPEQQRSVGGYIALDPRSGEKMIMLQPLAPTSNYTPNPNFHHLFIFDEQVSTYRFSLKDGNLSGIASKLSIDMASFDNSPLWIYLSETSSDPQELAAAKKRDAAAPQNNPTPSASGATRSRLDPTRRPAFPPRTNRGIPQQGNPLLQLPRGRAQAAIGNRNAAEQNNEKQPRAPRDEPPEPLRTFTDRSGKFSVKARFGGYINGEVILQRENGDRIKVPLSRLSDADKKWLESKFEHLRD